VVVTVPKGKPLAKGTPLVTRDRELAEIGPVFRRDRDVMNDMDRMRQEMDRIFDESFRSFRLLPDYKGWYDEHRFSSRYEINEEGGNYVVRVYLPARQMDNVTVKVEGQALHIDAQAEESATGVTKGGDETGNSAVHRAQYAQLVTLPGPVDALKMKVERKDHMLVVTLPKASSS
jgi:HSP20 family molecular chaperone IbpA